MDKSPSVNQTLNPLVLLSREFSLFANRTEIQWDQFGPTGSVIQGILSKFLSKVNQKPFCNISNILDSDYSENCIAFKMLFLLLILLFKHFSDDVLRSLVRKVI